MRPTELYAERAYDAHEFMSASISPISPRDFLALRQRRAFERQLLPFLRTAVDFDIVCEVGFHELTQAPLTVKHLILLELAPQMTVFRRLNRLCDLGVIARTRSDRDARVHELRLGSSVHALLMRYACRSTHAQE